MGSIDPIFVFKQHFDRSEIETIVKILSRHKPVWNRLKDESFLNTLIQIFPHELEHWSAARICLYAAGIDAHTPINDDIVNKLLDKKSPDKDTFQNIGSANTPLAAIAAAAAGLVMEARKSQGWNAWWENSRPVAPAAIDEGLGTVFSVAYELCRDRQNFLKGLSNASEPAAQKALAFVLIDAGESIFNGSGEITEWIAAIPRDRFIRVMEEIQRYGNQKILTDLAEKYLTGHPLSHTPQKNLTSDGLLEEIALNKDYALLYKFAGHDDQARACSASAMEIAHRLNQTLGTLHNRISRNTSEDSSGQEAGFIPGTDSDQDEFLGRVGQAETLQKTDVDAARMIAKSLFQDLDSSEIIRESLTTGQAATYAIPRQLIDLFLNVNLVKEAAVIADRLSDLQPLNESLLIQSAELNYRFGDFQKAIDYYNRLDVCRDLIREEKVHLADALEILDRWQEALEIWKTVNLVSLEDYQRIAICCYRAGADAYLDEVVKSADSLYAGTSFLKVIRALVNLRAGQTAEAQKLIEEVIASRKRDPRTIEFLLEFFISSGQYGAATSFISELSSLESNAPEVLLKRFELFEKNGNSGESRAVLAQAGEFGFIRDHATLEKLLQCLSANQALDLLDEVIRSNEAGWILSPRLAGFRAHRMIEKGFYTAARKTLQELIQGSNIREDWLIDFGLSSLECKLDKFPLGIPHDRITGQKSTVIQDTGLWNRFPENLILKVIQVELSNADRTAGYESIMASKGGHMNPELWRVYAGLGKCYFEQGQFDLAVVNLREAGKAKPENPDINLLLIRAFSKMRLFEDAYEVYQRWARNGKIELVDVIEVNACLGEMEKWQQRLEHMAALHPQNQALKFGLAKFYLDRHDQNKALETIRRELAAPLLSVRDRLAVAQLLIDSGIKESALQILETYLTETEMIQESDLLDCAFLFYQIGEYQRALTLVNLLEKIDYAVMAFKADLYQITGFQDEAQAAFRMALDLLEKSPESLGNHLNKNIHTPRVWEDVVCNPNTLYLTLLESRLAQGDLAEGLKEAQEALEKNPQDFRLKTLVMNLAYIAGEDGILEKLLDSVNEIATIETAADSVCIWGEAALKFGREIQAADLLSQCLERFPDSRRVKALQARMLKRNGNMADAQAIFEEVMADQPALLASQPGWAEAHFFWLAETALELEEYEQALHVCQQVRHKIQWTSLLELIFLKALTQISFKNWVNKRLQAAGHLVVLDEEINRLFGEIAQHYSSDLNNDDRCKACSLIREIPVWLEDGSIDYHALATQTDISPHTAMVACFKTEGVKKAEILLEKNPDDPRMVLVFAILTLDDEPEKALKHLANLMRSNVNSPQYYAALALVKQKMGQPEDAYAAINLALAAWPNEYKWHILAGEISKAAGDVHSSLNHFQKAAEMDQNGESQAYLGKLNLQAGNYLGISFLESQLAGNEQDFGSLLELGELSLKNDKSQKAVKYFEKAKKIDPADYRPHLGISRLALKIGNLKKARENLEVAYLLAPNQPAVRKQKAAILKQAEGTKAALDYLEGEYNQTNDQGNELAILKSRYIAELQGDEQALDYLLSQQGKSDNHDLQLELARQYLKMGRTSEAVEAAEVILRADPGNPYPLELMARAAQQNGDLDKAVDLLIKAVQVNPFEPIFYLDIAKIYQSRRENQHAIEILESGIRTNPYHFDLLHHLGLLYYQQGTYTQADICLKRAAAIRPEDENLKRMLSALTKANIIQEEPITNIAGFEE